MRAAAQLADDTEGSVRYMSPRRASQMLEQVIQQARVDGANWALTQVGEMGRRVTDIDVQEVREVAL